MTTFFGFGLADSMFNGDVTVARKELTLHEAKLLIERGVVPCLNPSHAETIRVMRERFGIDVLIPDKAPIVKLGFGDRLILMAVSGLPRLEGRHEYTPAEINGAVFRFALWTVQ